METVFSSLPQFLAVCLVLVCAEAVYVMLGFGAGLIAVGALALIMPEIRDVVVLLLLVNLPVEIYVVATSFRSIAWRGVSIMAAGIAAGLLGGTVILRWGEPTFLLTFLGAFLVVAGTVFLLLPQPGGRTVPAWTALPVGVSAGILGGLFGTGGPPLILYYRLQADSKAVFRGTLMALFLFMTPVRLVSYGATELLTLPRFTSALTVLPAVALGAWLGNRIHLQLSEDSFRRLISAALVVLGVLLLVRHMA